MLSDRVLSEPAPVNVSPEECFDRLFDKYSPCIYGILLQLVNTQPSGADYLLREIFVEIFSQHLKHTVTEKYPFAAIIAVLVNVTVRHGYSRDEIVLLLRKPAKPAGLLNQFSIAVAD